MTLPAVEAASLAPHNLPSALFVLAEILRAPALAYLSVAVCRLARVRVLGGLGHIHLSLLIKFQGRTLIFCINAFHSPFAVVSRWDTTAAQPPLLDFLRTGTVSQYMG